MSRPLRIAIAPDDAPLSSGRNQSFSERWLARAAEDGHDAFAVNPSAADLFERLRGCDGFMWFFWNAPSSAGPGIRIMSALRHACALRQNKVPASFPSWETIWFFEDKVSQHYLLDAVGLPMPATTVCWDADEAHAFARSASYPLVLKLAFGITSDNVRLVNTADEAHGWIDRIFERGISQLTPKAEMSTSERAVRQAKDAVHALRGGRLRDHLGLGPIQRDCVLFQQFLPRNDFDIRITVIGERAFAFRRFNRDDDFRASGSGRIDWDPEGIDPKAIRFAFEVADKLKGQVVAMDLLNDGERFIVIEVSYYYEAWAVEACPGQFLRPASAGAAPGWSDGAMRPDDAIYDDFLEALSRADS